MIHSYKDAYKNPQHPVYIFFGAGLEVEKAPNALHFVIDEYVSIDDARRIQEYASVVQTGEVTRIYIEAPGITSAAQHALLKTLEEIHNNTVLYFCFPPQTDVLPTLRSRCFVIDVASEIAYLEAEAFIAASPKDKLAFIEKLWMVDEADAATEAEQSNQKPTQRPLGRHAQIQVFLHGLEVSIHNQINKRAAAKKDRQNILLLDAMHYIQESTRVGGLTKASLQLLAFA